jgi:hypothetical protein
MQRLILKKIPSLFVEMTYDWPEISICWPTYYMRLSAQVWSMTSLCMCVCGFLQMCRLTGKASCFVFGKPRVRLSTIRPLPWQVHCSLPWDSTGYPQNSTRKHAMAASFHKFVTSVQHPLLTAVKPPINLIYGSRDNTVTIPSTLRARRFRIQIPAVAGDLALVQNVHTGSNQWDRTPTPGVERPCRAAP